MHTYSLHIKAGEEEECFAVLVYFGGHSALFSARCKLVSIRIHC